MGIILEVSEATYSDIPFREIDSCHKKDHFYYRQRGNGVLMINTKTKLITLHPLGFLMERDDIQSCSLEEFTEVLNTTIFELDILNGEYKISPKQ